jgi:hypothetical protein
MPFFRRLKVLRVLACPKHHAVQDAAGCRTCTSYEGYDEDHEAVICAYGKTRGL